MQLTEELGHRFRSSGEFISKAILRVFSGLIVGLTVALVAEEAFGIAIFSFVFITLTGIAVFWHFTRRIRILGIVVIDLILVLLAFVLHFYIAVGPEWDKYVGGQL